MPRTTEPLMPLWVMGSLVVVCVLIAGLGVSPGRVSAQDLWGSVRDPGDRAFIASHRGGAETAPENTLAAARSALAAGFDYVEVDLALTADGHPVLMHDRTVDRTTDGSGALADLTLEQVMRLDAGSWFSPDFAGTRIPRAEEFLDLLAERDGRALLDLKGEWDAVAAASLMSEVAARGLERRVVVASFDARVLAFVAAQSGTITRMAILRTLPADVVEATRQLGARGIVVDRRALTARPDVVEQLHTAGLRVIVYTLNDDRQWDEMTALGVDGIVTDAPVLLESWQRSYAGGGD